MSIMGLCIEVDRLVFFCLLFGWCGFGLRFLVLTFFDFLFFLKGPARKGVGRYFYYSGILFVFSWFFFISTSSNTSSLLIEHNFNE